MALRPCLDCHALVSRPRCGSCQRAYDNATGRNHYGVPASARGYGPDHQAERARWAPVVAEGTVSCARCGETIKAGDRWDLGHTEDRSGWTGPEHARCNRGARWSRAGAHKAFSQNRQTVTPNSLSPVRVGEF